jgi:hypothetical protein
MTWWETQEIATYLSDVESRLDEWSMSNSQMRFESDSLDRLTVKIKKTLSQTSEDEKKMFLEHLARRVNELQQHLTERLKRDIPR